MPNINDMMPSRFLKKENVMPDKVVTIREIKVENIAVDVNDPPKMKVVIYFVEFVQGLVLNQANKELLILVFNSEATEDWLGKTVTLGNEPGVSMRGRLTGGIRVKIPAMNVPNSFNNSIPQQPIANNTETAVNPAITQFDANGKPLFK